jgi:hypothetical protein
MHTDKPDAARAATTDFGLRRESRMAGATPLSAAIVQKAVSPLRFATAVQILSLSIRGCKFYRDKI